GIGPWLSVEVSSDTERGAQREMLRLVREGLDVATSDGSPDSLNFSGGSRQPLVDSAFLALGLLRSWDAVWTQLDHDVQSRVVDALLQTRIYEPWNNNWQLFSAIVEVFLRRAGAKWRDEPIRRALESHETWYLGDGVYGDGPDFRFDYYNSFVIHPFEFEVVRSMCHLDGMPSDLLGSVEARLRRYAAIQERHIAPDGTFLPVGRSLTYRAGAFHALSLAALESLLPVAMSPGGVRGALTAVIRRTLDPPGTFDGSGWLRLGLAGHQPSLAEGYISTGSLYLALCVMLPLGLPAYDEFWSAPESPWTSQLLWSGVDTEPDAAF
ncbi:MAG: DUF2264 domain-containing protein, partial [Actinomycetota bacterium]|nr:DUF2264 domain-containing protein [Actinomycetota bacterium]